MTSSRLMKKGRVERKTRLISSFIQANPNAGLVDITMEGYSFTWFKSLGMEREIEEKLDRATENNNWCVLFPNTKVKSLTVTTSYHYSILLCCDTNSSPPMARKGFRFENAWLMGPGFRDFVCDQWYHSDSEHDSIIDKLESCGENML